MTQSPNVVGCSPGAGRACKMTKMTAENVTRHGANGLWDGDDGSGLGTL
eukprot:COSAG02_NODE_7195_length_3126_cov_1.920714_3_plen_49_part_00